MNDDYIYASYWEIRQQINSYREFQSQNLGIHSSVGKSCCLGDEFVWKFMAYDNNLDI